MSRFAFHLDSDLRTTAIAFVERELSRDFAKAVRTRGERLAAEGLVEGSLDADEAHAKVFDQAETHAVRLTLPLFDATSRIQCACGQKRTSDGEPRCAHVVAVYKTILAGLAEITPSALPGLSAAEEDLFAALDAFANDPLDAIPSGTDPFAEVETRTTWAVDVSADGDLGIAPHTETRYGGTWRRGRRIEWGEFIAAPHHWTSPVDHLAAARIKPQRVRDIEAFDIDVFGLIEDLSGHPLVSTPISSGMVGLAVRNTDDAIIVEPQINGAPSIKQWVFAGRGLVTLAHEPRRLYFARCNRSTTDFLQRLDRHAHSVPLDQKERLLTYLVRLEQKLAVAVADTLVDPVVHKASSTLYLRLTPTQPAGVKLEVLVRPAPTGGYFPAGIGSETVLDVADADHPRNVARDLDHEAERARHFADAMTLNSSSVIAGHIFYLRTDDDALELVGRLSAVTSRHDWVVEWPKFAERSFEVAEPLASQSINIKIGEGRDWFDVEGGVEIAGQSIELQALIDAIRKKVRYVQLKDGRWARVTAMFEARIEKIAGLLEHDKGKLSISPASIPALVEWDPAADDVTLAAVSTEWKAAEARYRGALAKSYEVPEGFRAKLREYQREGFTWMCRLADWGMGGCLADDMGLGKTIQTLAVLARFAPEGPALVIAPTSVALNWVREAERFAPMLRPRIYRDHDRRMILATLKPGDLVICSYAIAKRDADDLQRVSWRALILDEAQAIKNFQTKTSHAIRSFNAGWRLALTGTPIETGLSELWSIFRVVAPGMLGTWEAFKRSYAMPIERWGMDGARKTLAHRLQPFILRRLKEDLLHDLPPKTEIDISVELSDDERKLYDAVRVMAVEGIKKREEKAKEEGKEGKEGEVDEQQRFAVLAALTKLRQIASHPGLFDPDWKGPVARLQAFLEIALALQLGGHRALVFSQFTSHLRILGDALASIGASWIYLDGSTPARKRQELVEEFQKGEIDFFLISIKAGGTGLTLTAADYVLHMDPWWNPAVEDQATDRAHRIGQTKPLTVYRFVSVDTVEEKILRLYATKRDLADSILNGASAPIDPSPGGSPPTCQPSTADLVSILLEVPR